MCADRQEPGRRVSVTVAVLGRRRISANSPKKSPGASVATRRFCRRTSAPPSIRTKNEYATHAIHAHDGGFAAFMRGARDGVEVEWDIYTVPARGGLPASEAIVSPDVGRERLESGNRLCWLTLRLGERNRALTCWGAGLSVGVAGLIEADVREIAQRPHRSGPTGDTRTGLTRRLALPRIGIGRLR